MPTISAGTAGLVGGVGVLLALVALLLAVGAQVRLGRARRALRLLRGHAGEGDVLELTARQTAEAVLLREQVEGLRGELEQARRDLAASLRHVAVVRYDAFGDMGGRLSFSAAVLDDAGDGLVLTAIHGRDAARTYAKGVVGGTSEHTLSPEELRAVSAARPGSDERARR